MVVRIDKVVTKYGDKGWTHLGAGIKTRKDSKRIAVLGSLDELSAYIGMLSSLGVISTIQNAAETLASIQQSLFDLGAEIATVKREASTIRLSENSIKLLEDSIVLLNAALPPLNSFILAGGTSESAWCHLARTVCRRAERDLVDLSSDEEIAATNIPFLNRLGDFLFVLARVVLKSQGKDEVVWVPGK